MRAAIVALSLFAATATAAPASPACALLSSEEAAALLGGAATVEDGGPSASGVTACAWRKGAVVVNAQVLAPIAFSSAATSAETYYDLIVKSMQDAQQPGEAVSGLGEKAYLVTIEGGGTPGFVTTILKTGKIATVWAIGLAKAEAIAAAQKIAARF